MHISFHFGFCVFMLLMLKKTIWNYVCNSYVSSEILNNLFTFPPQQNSQNIYICLAWSECVFVCMLKCSHSYLPSRELRFWHLKMWAVKTKPPPISSGSGVQNKGIRWRVDYTGESEPQCYCYRSYILI